MNVYDLLEEAADVCTAPPLLPPTPRPAGHGFLAAKSPEEGMAGQGSICGRQSPRGQYRAGRCHGVPADQLRASVFRHSTAPPRYTFPTGLILVLKLVCTSKPPLGSTPLNTFRGLRT